jgi:hypothetical protein
MRYRIVYDASGNPIETIFINWDKVTDIRINKGGLLRARFYKSIISIQYCISRTSHDGIVGVGAITYGAQQLGLAIEVQNFSATNFENKGVRQGIIQSDKQLNPGAKKLITSGVQEAMAVKSVDRLAVLMKE